MKRQFTVLILIICAKFSFGQTHAVKVDSIVKEKIAKLSLAKQNNYHNLISKRQETGFYERLDTIKCDYVYIEERFNILDSTITTFEYYFNAIQKGIYQNNGEHSNIVPDFIYHNGKQIDQRYTYYSKSVAGVIIYNLYVILLHA